MKRLVASIVLSFAAAGLGLYSAGADAGLAHPDARHQAVLESGRATITAAVAQASLGNGGNLAITGTAPPGKPVFIEIWAERTVKASRFDAAPAKDTGVRPYILYLSHDMPAYYKLLVAKDSQDKLDAIKKEGGKWSFSKALRDLGAEGVYSAPARIHIDRFQATLLGSIVGSRGELLPAMDEKENAARSMQLVKARFRDSDKVLGAAVETQPDGHFRAEIKIPTGLAPGNYTVVAATDRTTHSAPAHFENRIAFPNVYLENAGTSLNIFGPLVLTLAVTIFGVLMGAGGGFILNPLLLSIWPLPHTIVAGTVMPTVLFAQGSGIYNYSKIKFISWKLGIAIGMAMLLGAFIGPKLTELITLEQFKFVFGWILLVLAALMAWQTTPGYMARNKKEQAIMKEFQKRAAEAKNAAPSPSS